MSESKYICIRHRIIYILIPRIKYSIAAERTLKFVSPVILEQTVNVKNKTQLLAVVEDVVISFIYL